jgi:hypothetical protein
MIDDFLSLSSFFFFFFFLDLKLLDILYVLQLFVVLAFFQIDRHLSLQVSLPKCMI